MIEALVLGLALAVAVRAVAVMPRRCWRVARHPAPTFVFADLVGYTALTEARGDEAAARLAREFRRAMSVLSREHGAFLVKSMGDAVMIWVADAGDAIALAAAAVEQVGSHPDLLPVRVGVHTGPAVMEGCDWYGSAVNVAARLALEAAPNEALISDAARDAARNADPRLDRCRRIALRGIARPIPACPLTVTGGDVDRDAIPNLRLSGAAR